MTEQWMGGKEDKREENKGRKKDKGLKIGLKNLKCGTGHRHKYPQMNKSKYEEKLMSRT